MAESYLERNDTSLVRLRALVGRLTTSDLERSLGDGWTVKGALIHMAFWDRFATVTMERWAQSGIEPVLDDSDPINRAALPEWLAAPPDHALRAVLDAAERANDTAAALSDDLRTAMEAVGQRWDWRYRHREEHIEQLERELG